MKTRRSLGRLGGLLAAVSMLGLVAIGCDSDGGTSPAGLTDAGGTTPGPDSGNVNPGPDASGSGESGLLQSSLERETDLQIPPADFEALVAGNTAFGLDLYDELLKIEDGNLFYSPHSISLALAMTYAGAQGQTATEMAATMHFDLPQDQLHPAFNALDLELASRNQPAMEDAMPFRLNIANAIWGQKGYPFLDSFLDALAVNYGAGLRTLDFSADPESCRQTINGWVADRTEQRILDLIPDGAIDQLTRLVLTNAIYFNASWDEKFEEANTADGTFTLLDDTTVTVPLMHQEKTFGYAEGDGYQAVVLPYSGFQVDMQVILPAAGRFAEIEGRLGNGLLADIANHPDHRIVDLTMPKFSFESAFSVADALKALGMPTAFDAFAADFDAMADTEELYISDVIHKAFVAVDENGTEAAAATAVIMAGSGMPERATVTMDRPFLFLIRDQTGTVLFVGRVVDPS